METHCTKLLKFVTDCKIWRYINKTIYSDFLDFSIEEYWDPNEAELVPIVVKRKLPMIHIYLSSESLNESEIGWVGIIILLKTAGWITLQISVIKLQAPLFHLNLIIPKIQKMKEKIITKIERLGEQKMDFLIEFQMNENQKNKESLPRIVTIIITKLKDHSNKLFQKSLFL